MCGILCSFDDIDEQTKLKCLYLEKFHEYKSLEIELNKSKSQQSDKRFTNLERHCINIKLALQHEKEKNVSKNSWVKQSLISGDTEKSLKDKNDSLIVELNRKTLDSCDLRVQLQDKIIAYTELRESMNQSKVIMEYLVNISKRLAFWSLSEDILKINDSDYQYAVSIKEDTAYLCLHSPKTTKERRSIRRIQRRPIRRI
ncbi:hypothetical protein Tco_0019599 [Tanacetum coccineum]